MEGGSPGRLPSSVRDAIRAGSAGFGAFEKMFDVRLSGELPFFEYHWNHVVVDELGGFVGVDNFNGEDF